MPPPLPSVQLACFYLHAYCVAFDSLVELWMLHFRWLDHTNKVQVPQSSSSSYCDSLVLHQPFWKTVAVRYRTYLHRLGYRLQITSVEHRDVILSSSHHARSCLEKWRKRGGRFGTWSPPAEGRILGIASRWRAPGSSKLRF